MKIWISFENKQCSFSLIATSVSTPSPSLAAENKLISFHNQVEIHDDSGPVAIAELKSGIEQDGDKNEETSFALVGLDGKHFEVKTSLCIGGPEFPLPFSTSVVGVCLVKQQNSLHLILPRSSAVTVRLEIPSKDKFMLKSGDCIEVGRINSTTPNTTLQFDIPRPSRSLPKSKKDVFNPSQRFSQIAFETSSCFRACRRNSAAPQVVLTRPVTLWHQTKWDKKLTVGRSGVIHEADKALASHHATVIQESDGFYSLKPHNDKVVHLLLGKAQTYYRSPIALRLGDSFTIGANEFCIVFHQRGNLLLPKSNCTGSSPTAAVPFDKLDQLLAHYAVSESCAPQLILMTGSEKNKTFFLCNAEETTLGSDKNNTICVQQDKRVSDVHCRIFFDLVQERWVLEDLESTQGTFLKLSPSRPHLLCTGEMFSMGNTVMTVLAET